MLDVAPPTTGRGMLGGLPLISGGPTGRQVSRGARQQQQQLRTDYGETSDSYILTLDVPGAPSRRPFPSRSFARGGGGGRLVGCGAQRCCAVWEGPKGRRRGPM